MCVHTRLSCWGVDIGVLDTGTYMYVCILCMFEGVGL